MESVREIDEGAYAKLKGGVRVVLLAALAAAFASGIAAISGASGCANATRRSA